MTEDKQSSLRDSLYLWVDLEATGTDEKDDCIIEWGSILTDWNLEPIWEHTTPIKPTALGLGRMMQNPVVRAMHERNGLLDDVLNHEWPSAFNVGQEVIRLLNETDAKQGKVVLCGSGVSHYDRRFIKKYMGNLEKWLRHWHIDIGTIRRFYELTMGDDPFHMNNGKTHRAQDDIRCHLDEAKAFRNLWIKNIESVVRHEQNEI